MMEKKISVTQKRVKAVARVIFSFEMLMAAIAVVAGIVMTFTVVLGNRSVFVVAVSGTVLALSLICIVWLRIDPESVRARNTADVLKLADQMYQSMENGLTGQSAQEICDLLLPATAGIAVAITNREMVLGYSGYEEVENPSGHPIRTAATQEVVRTGHRHICTSAEEIGFSFAPRRIKAGIIVPLYQGREVVGTLKFYYRSAQGITDTQVNMATGFGQLLSTQMAAEALEEQQQLATSMELKALQAQINPHFLFNTINTISSFIRMDPTKARTLLREFATFYRKSLEETGDLVALSREIEQTMRYFYFEEARFGSDRVCLQVGVNNDVEDMLVPAFLIQPLVENAVRHARPAEGLLTVQVKAELEGSFLIVSVCDDGVGMTEEQRQVLVSGTGEGSTGSGLGIAMRNVHDRVQGYFGPGSRMEIESKLGEGTTIRLRMNLDSENLQSFKRRREMTAKTASAETISAGEVKSMAAVAEKSTETGVSSEIQEALSHLQ